MVTPWHDPRPKVAIFWGGEKGDELLRQQRDALKAAINNDQRFANVVPLTIGDVPHGHFSAESGRLIERAIAYIFILGSEDISSSSVATEIAHVTTLVRDKKQPAGSVFFITPYPEMKWPPEAQGRGIRCAALPMGAGSEPAFAFEPLLEKLAATLPDLLPKIGPPARQLGPAMDNAVLEAFDLSQPTGHCQLLNWCLRGVKETPTGPAGFQLLECLSKNILYLKRFHGISTSLSDRLFLNKQSSIASRLYTNYAGALSGADRKRTVRNDVKRLLRRECPALGPELYREIGELVTEAGLPLARALLAQATERGSPAEQLRVLERLECKLGEMLMNDTDTVTPNLAANERDVLAGIINPLVTRPRGTVSENLILSKRDIAALRGNDVLQEYEPVCGRICTMIGYALTTLGFLAVANDELQILRQGCHPARPGDREVDLEWLEADPFSNHGQMTTAALELAASSNELIIDVASRMSQVSRTFRMDVL